MIKLQSLLHAGVCSTELVEGEEILRLSNPCQFHISDEVVQQLRDHYKADEEIGGVLWVKLDEKTKDLIHLIDKVSLVRNAIADHPRADGKNKSNAYLEDPLELTTVLHQMIPNGYLPIKFHSQPTKGSNPLEFLTYLDLQTEASGQDRKESFNTFIVDGKKILMPRALVAWCLHKSYC